VVTGATLRQAEGATRGRYRQWVAEWSVGPHSCGQLVGTTLAHWSWDSWATQDWNSQSHTQGG
jgi:hypothetical protein